MKKTIIAMVTVATLAACGGGDDAPTASGPAIKLTYSGAPIVAARSARVMAAAASSTSGGGAASSAQATIDALQSAFKTRGADIGVYPGVVDGTALHQLVMAENGGVGPTRDEIYNANINISEWVLINFEFDDMTGYIDTPEKQAAVDQFQRDLAVYGAREYLKGRVVHAVLPIVSCKPERVERYADAAGYVHERRYLTASQALSGAISFASRSGAVSFLTVGGIYKSDSAHMGADCSTPDQFAQDEQISRIVDPLVINYRTALDTIDKCKHNPEAIPENERGAQCWGITPEKK
ncbi:hypothetical protein [Burkholderia thailandensis]|uniref:hypothetical protein n=1 Tax=Burkholderia thailandensis TaxID=57975 RepID=UPI00016A41A5|nr:hypothetical protein [Burkholderia thailandensis]AIP66677.1 hypothetical protein DR62_4464 [Burkholderia thailandensis]AOI55471.1 hypothetical protein WI24_27450 [Burkholderia thailandensis]UCR75708.1 hypothetical protein BtTXDOH_59 [Burkholderia phage phiBt-TXDOH]